MKNTVAGYGLLLCLFMPPLLALLGAEWSIKNLRAKVKQQMICGMDRKELVLLRFSEGEHKLLKWEHSREFEYQGEMYDVVEQKQEGNHIVYLCWPDRSETALNRKLKRLTQLLLQKDTQRDEAQKQLDRFFKTFFLPDPEQADLPGPFLVMGYDVMNYACLHGGAAPPTPPPR